MGAFVQSSLTPNLLPSVYHRWATVSPEDHQTVG